MNKKLINYFILVIGIILFGGGLILIKTLDNPNGVLRALPYIFVGIGCGIFGHSMGNILTTRIIRKYPDVKKNGN